MKQTLTFIFSIIFTQVALAKAESVCYLVPTNGYIKQIFNAKGEKIVQYGLYLRFQSLGYVAFKLKDSGQCKDVKTVGRKQLVGSYHKGAMEFSPSRPYSVCYIDKPSTTDRTLVYDSNGTLIKLYSSDARTQQKIASRLKADGDCKSVKIIQTGALVKDFHHKSVVKKAEQDTQETKFHRPINPKKKKKISVKTPVGA